MQGLFDNDAGARGADLSGVEEGAVEGVVHGDVEVSVSEDHVRVLTAEFECSALDGLGRILGDNFARGQSTGEGHHVHIGVLGQRVATVSPSAGDEVTYAVGQATFFECGHEQHGGVRRELGLLEYKGVTGSQCGTHLPGHL